MWWTTAHMVKTWQSYKQQKRGFTMGKTVQFCWQMVPLHPTISCVCQQIPTDTMDSHGFLSLFFSSGPNCSTDHCNCTFFFFFSPLKTFKHDFIKGHRQHVTLKKINFLWRATWKSVSCMVQFTLILFITLSPHFNLAINVISYVQHPPTEASTQITRLSCFMKLPKSDCWLSKHAE